MQQLRHLVPRQKFTRGYTLREGLAAGLLAWPIFDSGGWNTLLDFGKVASFLMSILSLCALLDSAFFVPATQWEDRLVASLAMSGFAGSICLISGVLFHVSQPRVPIVRTLPVRLYLWAIAGFSLFFVLGWYVEVYYMPLFWRNLPH
jgi:hypothetical protein